MKVEPMLGAPCWAHVATTDRPRTEAFYRQLFGWRAEADSAGYVRFHHGAEPVAGLGPQVVAGRPDAWRLRILVADAEETMRAAKELGARVVIGAADVGDTGRGAVLMDPTGAVFEIWQAGTFHGATVFSEPATPTWFELATRDPAGARRFYEALFGWTIGDGDWAGNGYARCSLAGRSFAGIVAMSPDHPDDVPPRWLVYIGAADVRATAARAKQLGGTVGAEPMDLPGGGGFVGLHDPLDTAFAVFGIPVRATAPAAVGRGGEPDLFELLFDHDRYRELVAGPPVTPVRYFDGSRVWLVTRHQYVEALLQDPRLSVDPASSPLRADAHTAVLPAEFVRFMRRALGSVDPPVHTRLRRLAAKAFTLARVTALRTDIERIAHGLLDAVATRDEVDLVEEYAYPLAVQVICNVLGVPEEARDGWRDAAAQLLWAPPAQIADGARRILEYTADLIALRRATPSDDLLSELVRVHDEDSAVLSDDELVAMVITFLNAGHETTAHLVGNGVHALLTHPDQLTLLRADPAALAVGVEELLRFTGPAELGIPRYTTEPVDVGGIRIPAGEVVQVGYAAANRDPCRFADPQRLDVTRTDNPHLGMGWGVHYCIGGHLGRAQGEIAIGALLQRFPDLALAVPAEEIRLRRGFARGLWQLPVRPGRDLGRERC